MKIKKNSSVRTIEAYAICQCIYALCSCGSNCGCNTSQQHVSGSSTVTLSNKMSGDMVNGTV